jgi:hypothetical protein
MDNRISKLLKQNAANVANSGTGSKKDIGGEKEVAKAWKEIQKDIKKIDKEFYEIIKER